MKKFLLPILLPAFVFLSFISLAQAPAVRLQKSVGGNGASYEPEFMYGTIGGYRLVPKVHVQTGNGNLVLAGNGSGAPLTFMCEVDNKDSILWAKYWGFLRLNGSFNLYEAQPRSLQPAVDSGFIMMGFVPQVKDAWVVRLNTRGDSVWQRFYGGSGDDEGAYIARVQNRGYIFIGTSTSFDGTLASARTADPATRGRVWVCRLDNGGRPLWSRCFGYEGSIWDRGIIIKPTRDGGFICGANMGTRGYADTSYHGALDIWLAKLDSTGTIQWARYYGGTADDLLSDVDETADGGFLFVGSTASTDGNVSGNHGGVDGWVVKITQSGSNSWQKCMGGTATDFLVDAIQTQDGGFAAIGSTWSHDGDGSGTRDSTTNVLLAKLSANGTIAWRKTIGGYFFNYGRSVLETSDNEYVISGSNLSYSGDPLSNKNWYARLGAASRIYGTVFYDFNNNGIFDPGDKRANNLLITASKQGNYQRSALVTNGQFAIDVDTGSYTTVVNLASPYFTVSPSAANSRFNTYLAADSVGFRIVPVADKQDLSIRLMPVSQARPGFSAMYQILYQNGGTTMIPSGSIILKKDHRSTFYRAIPDAAPRSNDSAGLASDTLTWYYNNLKPGDSAMVYVQLVLAPPPSLNIGDTLGFTVSVNPISGDETPTDNSATLRQRVVGSYDPNDKTESNAGVVQPSFITSGTPLQYTIRFQNTGTDTAFSVVVRDTLSSRVDPTTLQMVASSHPYSLSMDGNGRLAWQFTNINLPDSNRNEPASHGYIVYTVKPKSDVVVGETIHNTASIYFDYNLPVWTNDAPTLVRADFSVLPQGLLRFYGNRQGSKVSLLWKTAIDAGIRSFEIERSTNGTGFSSIGTVSGADRVQDYSFADHLSGGSSPALFYRLKLVLENGRSRYSDVLLFKEAIPSGGLDVYPNPIGQQACVAFESSSAGTAELQLINTSGALVGRASVVLQPGRNVVPLHRAPNLSPGIYTVRLQLNGKERIASVLLQ